MAMILMLHQPSGFLPILSYFTDVWCSCNDSFSKKRFQMKCMCKFYSIKKCNERVEAVSLGNVQA